MNFRELNTTMRYRNSLITSLIIILLIGCQEKRVRQSATNNQQIKSAMLLGVYHFDNPGMDTHNMELDDYLSESRQNEIKEVVELLQEYNPTKIFIEFTPDIQPMLDSLYYMYLEDKITLEYINGARNEVYQIGFRLGKRLDGIEIVAVDHPGNWLGPYADFIADTLSLDFYNEKQANRTVEIEERQNRFLENSIRENLIYINDPKSIAGNHDYYNNVAIKVKDTAEIMFTYQETEAEIDGLPYLMRSFDFNNIGVDLVTEWYKRNLFIYRNIIENVETDDRILIIFGQGHIHYLNQLLSDNPEFDLVSPNEVLD